MRMAEEKTFTVEGVHPTSGFMAVMVIPGSREGEEPEMVIGSIFHIMGTGNPGIVAGIVVEIGPPLPGQMEETFQEGDKVFFSADRGIPIGDRTFLAQSSPIGYLKADEA